MNNGTSIKQLVQMSIGQIRALESAQQTIQNIVDAQKGSVKDAIEKAEIEDDWAAKFLEGMNENK